MCCLCRHILDVQYVLYVCVCLCVTVYVYLVHVTHLSSGRSDIQMRCLPGAAGVAEMSRDYD